MGEVSQDEMLRTLRLLIPTGSLNQVQYAEISEIGRSVDLLDVMVELRRQGLFFVTGIYKRLDIKDQRELQSIIVSIQNNFQVNRFFRYNNTRRLRIKDSLATCTLLSENLRLRLTVPPAERRIQQEELIPLTISFVKKDDYSKLLPTENIVEILQELKVKGDLPCINGVTLKFLTTTRRIADTVFIRIESEEEEEHVSTVLQELGNTEVSTLVEKQFLCLLSIWAQAFSHVDERNREIHILDNDIIARDILTNGRSTNHITNRMGPLLN